MRNRPLPNQRPFIQISQMASLQKLIIFGAGGLGSEVAWTAENCNSASPTFEIVGFCDDDPAKKGATFFGYPVLGTPEQAAPAFTEKPGFICAIGKNRLREKIVARMLALGWTPVSVADPSVIKARGVTIGPGTYVAARCTISPNARVGSHVILNLNCSITHDNQIGDYAQVCPGARVSGYCIIKTGALIGSNAVIAQWINMGQWSTLGANSFAISHIPDGATAIGNPARIMFKQPPTVTE